jgi:hypothetical protein
MDHVGKEPADTCFPAPSHFRTVVVLCICYFSAHVYFLEPCTVIGFTTVVRDIATTRVTVGKWLSYPFQSYHLTLWLLV